VPHFASEREDLGPLARSVADGRVLLGTVVDYPGDVGKRFGVVDTSRFAEESRHGRERRSWSWHAAMALDGGYERCFLAADERAGAFANLHGERQAAAHDVLAEEPLFGRLFDGHPDVLHGKWILGAHVDEALRCADGTGGYRHALEH